MKHKGLILPGYACTSQIWQPILADLSDSFDLSLIDWPHELIVDFHEVKDFSRWLNSIINTTQYDFVIGHSMGGLVALELAIENKDSFKQVILIETFLTSVPPFFQNLFLESTSERVKHEILNMLDREKVKYSPKLGKTLQHVELSQKIFSMKKAIHALYGDRGNGDPDQVRKALDWSHDLQRQINISVVPNACHFPMIENAEITAQLLKNILM